MAAELRKYSTNEELFRQGRKGEWCGVIREGMVEVYREDSDGEQTPLATLGKGEVFGELAILSDNDRRSATVRATEYTEVMQVSKADMDAMLAKSSPIFRAIVMTLIKRMQSMLSEK